MIKIVLGGIDIPQSDIFEAAGTCKCEGSYAAKCDCDPKLGDNCADFQHDSLADFNKKHMQ